LARETVEVPITGKIISASVKVGDEVKEGDTLCILESMKMENPILAPVNSRYRVLKAGDLEAFTECGKGRNARVF